MLIGFLLPSNAVIPIEPSLKLVTTRFYKGELNLVGYNDYQPDHRTDFTNTLGRLKPIKPRRNKGSRHEQPNNKDLDFLLLFLEIDHPDLQDVEVSLIIGH